ncbi:MurR/RpiR family transcriptional regulator [Nitrincola alkalilacustris]|uniref:MurR/RpiR family transcriptional regulator n=1 Tax=Nitrincola alkalilacustris TaxID=1571224 RepID=UPI00124C4F9F|nr:MurR/RpiR family transcriptional regulator [Nitrincola alkalilacustris]
MHQSTTPSEQVFREPPSVPDSMDALRALSLSISKGNSRIKLGPKARQVLARLIELRGDKALLSISSLAQRLQVNPSTISRLARTLGYQSFGDLQQVLLSESFAAAGSFYIEHAQAALTADTSALTQQASRLCHEQQANIERLIESLERSSFEQCTKILASANRVRIHGARQFHAYCAFISYGLATLRSDVSLLEQSLQGAAEGLAALDKGDLLVIASCEPYTSSVIRVAEAAKAAGIQVIAITDRSSSPLVAHSDLALFVPHETSYLSNSMTAFFSLAECLINACASQLKESALQAIKRRDAFIQSLKIES